MTYKQIEQMREIRLWIGQIVVPAGAAVVSLMTIPEVREAVATGAKSVKQTIERKMKKKEKEAS